MRFRPVLSLFASVAIAACTAAPASAQSRTVPAGDALEQTPPIDQTRNQVAPGDRVQVPIAPNPPGSVAPAAPPVVQKSGEAAKSQ